MYGIGYKKVKLIIGKMSTPGQGLAENENNKIKDRIYINICFFFISEPMNKHPEILQKYIKPVQEISEQ